MRDNNRTPTDVCGEARPGPEPGLGLGLGLTVTLNLTLNLKQRSLKEIDPDPAFY